MRIIYRRRPKKIDASAQYKVNRQIRAPEVRVIDENGNQLGVLATMKAIQTAEEHGLDLVEVNPQALPPVTKIMDYGKFKYEKEKEMSKQKAHQKKFEVKGVRLSSRIGQHDLDIRKAQALNFLQEGHKVQVELIVRGRERQFSEISKDVIKNFVNLINVELPVKMEQTITKQGNKFSCLVARQ